MDKLVNPVTVKEVPVPLYNHLISSLKNNLFSLVGIKPSVVIFGCENKNVTSAFISRFLARKLAQKYNEEVDRESAFEMLSAKLKQAAPVEKEESKVSPPKKAEKSDFEKILESKTTQVILKEVTRGILGILGAKTTRRKSSSGGLGGILGF